MQHGSGCGMVQYGLWNQGTSINHYLCLTEQPLSLQSQEVRVPWPGTNKDHLAWRRDSLLNAGRPGHGAKAAAAANVNMPIFVFIEIPQTL